MSTSAQPAPDDFVDSNSDDGLPAQNVNELIATSGLPDQANELILRIVKRTRLSRREKVGVAIELIAHFGDGLDAEVPIEDLLAGFGDEATLAKLIRRSKMRCRSWLRRAMRRTGQALVCLIVFYVGAIFYYASGTPNIAVDYVAKLNESILAAPEQERAWPIYREALLALDREQLKTLAEHAGVQLGDPTWNKAVALVQASQPALEKLRKGAARPHLGYVMSTKIHKEDRELWPEEYEEKAKDDGPTDEFDVPTIAMLLPYASELHHVGSLLAWDAMLAAERGDGDRVVEDIEAILGMARQIHRPGASLIDQLVAMAITHKAIDALRTILRHTPAALTDENIQRLAHRLAEPKVTPDISLGLERAFFQDILQRLYTDEGNGDGHITPRGVAILRSLDEDDAAADGNPGADSYLLAPAAAAFYPSRKELTAKYELFMDGGSEAHEWWDSLSGIERARYKLVEIFTPAFYHPYMIQRSGVGRRDGMLTALALEMYRRRNGSYPKSLDDLSPRFLPSVPRDRSNDSQMLYRVDGDRAVVYYVGQDGDDDGGVVPADLPHRPFIEIPEDADEKTAERHRQHNERLREFIKNETPSGRRKRVEKELSPEGKRRGKDAPDGDWVLWHSADWPVERDATTSKND